MNKQQYVAEIISEELGHYNITQELIQEVAQGIVHGLDMWYELSGDSKEQKLKDARKELEREERKHKEEMEEVNGNVRWMKSRYQEQIEELQKQIR